MYDIAEVGLKGRIIDDLADTQGKHDQYEDAVISEKRAKQAHTSHHHQDAYHDHLTPEALGYGAQYRTEKTSAIGQRDNVLNAVGGDAETCPYCGNKGVGEALRDIDDQSAED